MEHSAADYETGTFPHLAARVRLLKEKKEGIDIMCDILEKEWPKERLKERPREWLQG